jgi:hypothetical protein
MRNVSISTIAQRESIGNPHIRYILAIVSLKLLSDMKHRCIDRNDQLTESN